MEYVDKLIGLLSEPQWRTIITLVLISMAVTETVKRVFLLQPVTAAQRKRVVYATAFATGVMASVWGWLLEGTAEVSTYYWASFGVISGPLSNLIHWLTLGIIGWKFPDFAKALKGRK